LRNGQYSRARGINARGEVVGYAGSSHASRAFVWTRSAGMQDLNTLLTPAASGFVLTEAVAIDDQGRIVAIGRDDHHGGGAQEHDDDHEAPIRVFLLVPAP
jgi:probable HAF family extracellular repeat protein